MSCLIHLRTPKPQQQTWKPERQIQYKLRCQLFPVQNRVNYLSSSIYLLKTVNVKVQFSCSVVSDSLRPHEPQHTRPPCPSPTPGVYPNSCSLSWWCHPAISASVTTFSPWLQSFPALVFSNQLALCIRWPKYWNFSFSISPFNEHSGLMSITIDWFQISVLSKEFSSLV